MNVQQQNQQTQDQQLLRWWEHTKELLVILTGLVILGLIGVNIAGYWFGWNWTGLNPYTSSKGDYYPGKTLWDWMDLLIVPVVIGIAAYWFRQTEQALELKRAAERANTEQRRTEERTKTEQLIAEDNLCETALQTYFDRMVSLLLDKELREKQEDAEVRAVARARTMTILRRLDSGRKGVVVRFLHEAKLITRGAIIIDLEEADLTNVELAGVNLTQIDLARADLSNANLRFTNLTSANLTGTQLSKVKLYYSNLSEADLSRAKLMAAKLTGTNLSKTVLTGAILKAAKLIKANLTEADLTEADLTEVNLEWANLTGANLTGANLTKANLEWAKLAGANLMGADLRGAKVTQEQLAKAGSREGMIFPDGSVYQTQSADATHIPTVEPHAS
jgi:uncharacterized protein YjbI with pentapeptide repeats